RSTSASATSPTCRWRSDPEPGPGVRGQESGVAQASLVPSRDRQGAAYPAPWRSRLVPDPIPVSAMLDRDFDRDNLEAGKANLRNRNVTVDIDQFVALDDRRRQLLHQQQTLQQQANQVQKQVPQAQNPTQRQALIAQGQALRTQVSDLEKQVKEV